MKLTSYKEFNLINKEKNYYCIKETIKFKKYYYDLSVYNMLFEIREKL